jgi:hypothetical protein
MPVTSSIVLVGKLSVDLQLALCFKYHNYNLFCPKHSPQLLRVSCLKVASQLFPGVEPQVGQAQVTTRTLLISSSLSYI